MPAWEEQTLTVSDKRYQSKGFPMIEVRAPNTDPLKSAQNCGCDEGANHQCEGHRTGAFTGPGAITRGRVSTSVAGWAGHLGIGGAPTRSTVLPNDPKERKKYPIGTGVLDYFPDAIAEVAHVSWLGNEQHNPGMPLHWDRSKSQDEADTMQRHYSQRGTRDKDGSRHTAKMVWRALAMLQKEIEAERGINRNPESASLRYEAGE